MLQTFGEYILFCNVIFHTLFISLSFIYNNVHVEQTSMAKIKLQVYTATVLLMHLVFGEDQVTVSFVLIVITCPCLTYVCTPNVS